MGDSSAVRREAIINLIANAIAHGVVKRGAEYPEDLRKWFNVNFSQRKKEAASSIPGVFEGLAQQETSKVLNRLYTRATTIQPAGSTQTQETMSAGAVERAGGAPSAGAVERAGAAPSEGVVERAESPRTRRVELADDLSEKDVGVMFEQVLSLSGVDWKKTMYRPNRDHLVNANEFSKAQLQRLIIQTGVDNVALGMQVRQILLVLQQGEDTPYKITIRMPERTVYFETRPTDGSMPQIVQLIDHEGQQIEPEAAAGEVQYIVAPQLIQFIQNSYDRRVLEHR